MLINSNRVKENIGDICNLYGQTSNPFYVYAPRWIEKSAGIRALHYLCHSLNMNNQKAYLVFSEDSFGGQPRVNPNLNTPILTKEIASSHFNAKLQPIVIYSETVPGNPLKAEFVVRYLMNYVGNLGGPDTFDSNEYLIAYSSNIAKDAKSKGLNVEKILFLPAVDPRQFVISKSTQNEYFVVYSGKYDAFVGKLPDLNLNNIIKITRESPNAQTREDLIKLLSECKATISYENSSIITESILAGTPGVFIQNEFLGQIIAEEELGLNGIAFNLDEKEIERAKSTIDLAADQYFKRIQFFKTQLNDFIYLTQKHVKNFPYSKQITIPNNLFIVNGHRIRLSIQIIRNKGFIAWIRVTFSFIKRYLAALQENP